MTEENNDYGSEPTTELTPGGVLRQAREEQGLTVNDIAEKLYLKPSLISTLENDELDNSKSLTFTKGYIKNYAKLVGVNVEEIVALFEQFHNKTENTAKLQSFSKRVAQQAHDDRWMMVTYLILLVIVGGVVWWWLQQPSASVGEVSNTQTNTEIKPTQSNIQDNAQVTNELQQAEKFEPETESSGGVDPEDLGSSSDTVDKNELTDTDLSINPQTTDDVFTTDLESLDSTLPSESEETVQNTPIETPLETTATYDVVETTAQRVPVVFTFSQDCWINIVDGTGEAIAYGVKDAGYVMEINGIPPFEVTLGQPQAVSIVYNGEAVDMSGYNGNQIARLVLPAQD